MRPNIRISRTAAPPKRRRQKPADATPNRRDQKRAHATEDPAIPDDRPQKRQRESPEPSAVDDTSGQEAAGADARLSVNPIDVWSREGHWPREYFEEDPMERLHARRRSPSLRRKRSESGLSSTASDQNTRDEKSAQYRNPQYELVLQTKETYNE